MEFCEPRNTNERKDPRTEMFQPGPRDAAHGRGNRGWFPTGPSPGTSVARDPLRNFAELNTLVPRLVKESTEDSPYLQKTREVYFWCAVSVNP